jgi:hypothetical protein
MGLMLAPSTNSFCGNVYVGSVSSCVLPGTYVIIVFHPGSLAILYIIPWPLL